MSNNTLIIASTVDALGPEYSSTHRAFGVTLSAAFLEPDLPAGAEWQLSENDLELLKPWNWDLQDAAVVVWIKAPSIELRRLADVTPKYETATPPNALKTALNIQFEKLMAWRGNSAARSRTAFGWNTDPARTERRVWPTALARLSTLPHPYNQQLRLSFIVYIPNADLTDAQAVIIAPQFTVTGKNGLQFKLQMEEFMLPTHAPDVAAGARTFEWRYRTTPADDQCAIAYVAAANPVIPPRTLARDGTRPLVNLQTQWIHKPDNAAEHAYAHDWRATLLTDLADGFDLARALLESARDVVYGCMRTDAFDNGARVLSAEEESNRTKLMNGLPLLVELVMRVLRDLADYGARQGPSGDSFLDQMLALWARESTSVTADEQRAVRQLIANQHPDDSPTAYPAWIALIRKSLPDVAASNILRLRSFADNVAGVTPPPTFTVQEWAGSLTASLEELQRVHDRLRDDATLASVVAAQWENIPLQDAVQKTLLTNFLNTIRAFNYGDAPTVLLLAQGVIGSVILPEQVTAREMALYAVDGKGVCGTTIWDMLMGRLSSSTPVSDIGRELPEHIRTTIVTYAEQRCLHGIPTFNPALPLALASNGTPGCTGEELWELLRPGILRHADQQRLRILEARRPVAGAAGAVVPATRAPHPLTFQIDRLAPDAVDGSQEDCDDFLRRFSGSAVLMRESMSESQKGVWKCLNMANAATAVAVSGTQEWKIPELWERGSRASLVPMRSSYSDDLRQAFVTYDGLPLAGRSPMAELLRHSPEETEPDPANESISDEPPALPPPVEWIAPQVADDSLQEQQFIGTVPALSFGRNYDIAPFVIGNCGALPFEIAESGNPAKLRPPSAIDATLFGDAVRNVPYRRRVRIGAPRVAADNSPTLGTEIRMADVIPPVPDRCFPRLRELFASKDPADSVTPILVLSDQSTPSDLAAAPESHVVQVRPPATDIYTWDRWQNSIADRNHRKLVWGEYAYRVQKNHEFALRQRDGEPPEDDYRTLQDVSVNDPAITHMHVVYEWVLPYSVGGAPQVRKLGSRTIPLIRPGDVTGLEREQRGALKLRFSAHLTGSQTIMQGIGEKSNELAFSMRRGGLYRVRVFSVVNSAQWSTRCDKIYADSELMPIDEGYALSPLDFLVEIATPDMPAANALTKILTPRFSPTPRQVVLNAEVSQSNVGECAWLVGTLELRRQRWIWDGRPMRRMPFADSVTPNSLTEWLDGRSGAADAPRNSLLLEWETEQFNTRPIADSVRLDMERFRDANCSVDVNCHRWTEQLEDEQRAVYFRFALVARSRYEGVYGRDLAVLASRTLTVQNDDQSVTNSNRHWWAFYVPSARKGVVPAPVLKVLLPLTRRSSSREATSNERKPGILAVFRDVWYDFGGIVEELKADVAVASRVYNNPKQALEFAPDPIATADNATWTSATFRASGEQNSNVVGPVGHSFDGNASGAFFGSTSFVIHLPDTPAGSPAVPDWTFIKLQFRRLLYGSGYYGADDNLRPYAVSEPTPAAWMQYLPPFEIETPDEDLTGIPQQFDIRKNGQLISIASKSLARKATGPRTRRFAILTREVVDMLRPLNREPQEAFVAAYGQSGSPIGEVTTWCRLKGDATSTIDPRNESFILRTIDVQFVDEQWTAENAVEEENALWGHLFDVTDVKLAEVASQLDSYWPSAPLGTQVNVNAERKRARIVSISQPLVRTADQVKHTSQKYVLPQEIAGDGTVGSDGVRARSARKNETVVVPPQSQQEFDDQFESSAEATEQDNVLQEIG